MGRGRRPRQAGPARPEEVEWAADLGYSWNGFVWVCTGCEKEPAKAEMAGHSRACPVLYSRRRNAERQGWVRAVPFVSLVRLSGALAECCVCMASSPETNNSLRQMQPERPVAALALLAASKGTGFATRHNNAKNACGSNGVRTVATARADSAPTATNSTRHSPSPTPPLQRHSPRSKIPSKSLRVRTASPAQGGAIEAVTASHVSPAHGNVREDVVEESALHSQVLRSTSRTAPAPT